MNLTYKTARRIVIAMLGATVIFIGILLLVLPGPGMVVIAGGLALLATEFVWARVLLRRARRTAGHVSRGLADRFRNGRRWRAGSEPPPMV
jgi:tellurite resistance protein TerC